MLPLSLLFRQILDTPAALFSDGFADREIDLATGEAGRVGRPRRGGAKRRVREARFSKNTHALTAFGFVRFLLSANAVQSARQSPVELESVHRVLPCDQRLGPFFRQDVLVQQPLERSLGLVIGFLPSFSALAFLPRDQHLHRSEEVAVVRPWPFCNSGQKVRLKPS